MSTIPSTPKAGAHDEGQSSPSQPVSSTANIEGEESPVGRAPTQPDNWKGNPDYFQQGQKAGQLKPRARGKAGTESPACVRPLDTNSLKATERVIDEKPVEQLDKKALKAEKKLVEAKVAAKFVMRILDTLTGWISKGSYGENFSEPQRKERNKYRAELEKDWEDYLITLDIPMHPAIVAIMGSMLYVAPAFETVAGQARTQSIKEKLISGIVGRMFGGKK